MNQARLNASRQFAERATSLQDSRRDSVGGRALAETLPPGWRARRRTARNAVRLNRSECLMEPRNRPPPVLREQAVPVQASVHPAPTGGFSAVGGPVGPAQ